MTEAIQGETNSSEFALDLYERLAKEVFFEYGDEAIAFLLDEIIEEISQNQDLKEEVSGGIEPEQLHYERALHHPKVISDSFTTAVLKGLLHLSNRRPTESTNAIYFNFLDKILLLEDRMRHPLEVILVLMTEGQLPHSNPLWHEFIHSFQRENSFFYKLFFMAISLNVFPFLYNMEPNIVKIIAVIDILIAFYAIFEKNVAVLYNGSLHFSEIHAYLAGDAVMTVPNAEATVNHVHELYGDIVDEPNTKQRLQNAAEAIIGLRALGISHKEIAKISSDKKADLKLSELIRETMSSRGIDKMQLEERVSFYLKKREILNQTVRLQTVEKVQQFLDKL